MRQREPIHDPRKVGRGGWHGQFQESLAATQMAKPRQSLIARGMGTRKVGCLATCSSTSGYRLLIVRATRCEWCTEGSRSRVSKHSMIAEGMQGKGNGTKVPHEVLRRHSHRRVDFGLTATGCRED